MLAPLSKRRKRQRQEQHRRADEEVQNIRTQVRKLHWMSRRFLTHRITPAMPQCAILRIGNEPVGKPSKRQHRALWHGWRDSMREESDRKSTRLNSSHSQISYAVFCLKKK